MNSDTIPPIAQALSASHEDRLRMFMKSDEIQQCVRSVSQQINERYKHSEQITLIIILRGAFIFASDLIRHLEVPVEMDFVRLRSYGDAMESAGHIELTKDIEITLRNKDIIIVDEIIDTGFTTEFLKTRIQANQPHSVSIAVLLDKKSKRKAAIDADFVGREVEDRFLIGYGLDYQERYRQLADIYYVVTDT
jgi:hypoxanthine phosphoribosyltransferase